MNNDANFMTAESVSKILGVSLATLENWRREKKGLAFCKFGRHIRYKSSDVLHFINQNKVEVVNG